MISPKGLSICSLTILAIAFLYKKNYDSVLSERLQSVLDGLLRAEKKIAVQGRTRVGVGFGGCYDACLSAKDVMKGLGLEPSGTRKHHDVVNSLNELEELLSYYFYHGAAAERYVGNGSAFEQIVRVYRDHAKTRWSQGGNAPVMANRLAMEGCEVLLGARTTPNVKFSDHVRGIGQQERDDIHILMEYDRGEQWGNITSPRANRLIVHNDHFNPLLAMVEEYAEEMRKFNPKLFVLGGLQMMDNFPFAPGKREERLTALQHFMKDIPVSTLVHFEMASFTEEALLHELLDRIVPLADSLGMNEQELPNLLAIMANKEVQLVADSNPRVATTLDDMRELLDAVTKLKGPRKLTRVHVHTLAYQAIITIKGSPWTNTMAAAAKASLVANRHVCGNRWINLEKARLILDDSFAASRGEGAPRVYVKDDRPVSCWEEGDRLFCVAPNLVCTDIYQTAGGGDNISAAGLAPQIK